MQTLLHGLPVYIADIMDDDECGIKRISLVTSPAVEREFVAFAEQRALTYSIADDERRHILGVVMRANYPIYRKDGNTEYFIMYRPAAIERMAEKYLREGRQNNVNIQHVDGSDVDGVEMVQWFIKDTAKGINPAAFPDVEDGSLFAEFHVTNDDVWSEIKNGTFRGFSLEGVFTVEPSDAIPSDEKMPPELISWLKQSFQKLSYCKKMDLLKEIKELFASLADVKFGSATTLQGVIYWDGDAELAVGDAVFVDGENGERVAAPDGDYTFEDGHVVTVADGKVTEIGEVPEPEPEPTEEEEMRNDFADARKTIADAYSMSYNTKTKKIADAIFAKGFDGWIVEAGDDFAVIDTWNDNGEKYWRFGVTWEGEEPIVSEPVEVFPSFVTAEDIEKINAGKEAVENMRKEYDRMKTELDELKSKSKSSPAHEEFSNPTVTPTEKRKMSKEMQRIMDLGAALRKK